ncbi:MAG TPA: MYXO-CTERM sorting domain-containing protein [Myxococcales bacterium]|jgi:uncharacterized protein (TIGR03382 family)
MRLRLTPLLLLLAATGISGSAWAQTTTVVSLNQPTIVIASGNSSAFNQATCQVSEGGTAVAYAFPSGFSPGATKLTVFATDQSSCPETPPDAAKVLLNKTLITTANQSATLRVVARDLEPDCPALTTKEFLICAVTTTTTINATTGAQQDTAAFNENVIVTYDSLQPSTPTISSIVAGDSAVTLNWTSQSEIDHWIIYFRPNGPPPPPTSDLCNSTSSSGSAITQCLWTSGADGCVVIDCDSADANCVIPADAAAPGLDAGPTWDASPSFNPNDTDGGAWDSVTIDDGNNGVTSGRVTGLTNDQKYEFVLVAVDLATNVSAGSDAVDAIPLVVHDFYRRYQCAGGNEKGGFGCSSAGMAVLLPAAGLAVLALIRRRRAS